MRRLCIVAVVALLLYSLNLTIPMWWATLVGNDRFLMVMTSAFGYPEQIADLVVSTLVTGVGVISLIFLIRRGKWTSHNS